MFIGTGHQIVKQRIDLSYRSFELIESHEGVERACNAPRPTSFSCVVQQIENCLFEHRFSSPLWPGKLLKIRYTRELGEKQVDQTREKGVLFHQRFISDIIARKIAPCCPSNSQQTVPDHASRFLQHLSLSLSVALEDMLEDTSLLVGKLARACTLCRIRIVLRAAQTIARENVYSANLV